MTIKKALSILLAVMMLMGIFTASITATAADVTYSDVNEGMWSYDAIKYVSENGLMNGTGGSTFSPAVNLTRAMVVTVLYRMEGSPAIEFSPANFMDVPADQFYSEAVQWAFNEKIVTGTGTDDWGIPYFSPNREITRQELATMFIRYAAFKYINTDANTNLDKFTDKAEVATWASDAMKWATNVGLINGTGNGNTLSPAGKATREQFATIIYRFKTLDFEYDHHYSAPVVQSTFTEKEYPLVENADLYVAVDGNDSNPGTKDKPLATFEAAKLKVRELKKTAKDEIVVAFKAGNYGKLDAISFSAEDTGSEKTPIKYCKYGDGEVIFSNGYTIKNSDFTSIEESDKYLFKAENYDSIKKVDLSNVLADGEAITTLFADVGICHEARYPNKNTNGTDRCFSNMTTTVDKYCSIMLQTALPEIVESFRTTEGMRVTGFLRVGWLIETFDVKSYDPETKILTFNTYEGFVPPSGYPIGESAGGFDFMFEGRTEDTVYFSNLSDQLDNKGEFWFNPETKDLFIYKPSGNYTIVTGGVFMNVGNADYITFEGFTFNGSNANIAFSVEHSDDIVFDSCKFLNYAGDRIMNVSQIRNFKFRNNEVYNFGATGLYITPFWKDRVGDFENSYFSAQESGVEIDNNYFHDFGFIDMWSGAINFYCNSGSRVSHNYFKNGAHCAVEFNSSINILIEYNVFDNMMMTTADYGAIYTNWGFEDRGNVIRYNLFTNIRAAGAQYAIYLDDGDVCGVEIYGNLFHDAGSCAVTSNGGRDHNIHDNVFVNSGANEYRRFLFMNFNHRTDKYLEGELSITDYVQGTDDMMKTLKNDVPKEGEPGYEIWSQNWPIFYQYHDDITKLGDPNCIFTTINYVTNNYQIGDKPISEAAYLKWGVGQETNKVISVNDNPLFVNPAKGDYRIKDGVDFDLPFEMMGRY